MDAVPSDEALLDRLQRGAFSYFLEAVNPANGLIADTSRAASPVSIAVVGFAFPMHDVDRAIADDEEAGFVKIHVKARTDRILGATIVARHAGEMINKITLAMVAGIGLGTLARITPRLSDPGRRDQESGGRLQPHAFDADDPIAAAALVEVVTTN